MKNGQNNKNALYVWNLNQFDKVKSDITDFLLGMDMILLFSFKF